MAKRFTDSRKWDDGWFLELSNDNKILWIYLLDKCNHAGIYKKSPKLELCCLGFTIIPEILVPFEDRIKTIDNDKYFIPKFIKFQYGELNPAVNCHKSVIEELKRTVNQPLFKGCSTLKDKDKDKDKDIFLKPSFTSDSSKKHTIDSKSIIVINEEFEKIWKKYPNKDGKKASFTHFKGSVKTEKDVADIHKALENYLASEKVQKGFIKNGSTWFNNWRDWVEPPLKAQNEVSPETRAFLDRLKGGRR